MKPVTCCFYDTALPVVSWNLLMPCPVLGLRTYMTMPSFNVGVGDVTKVALPGWLPVWAHPNDPSWALAAYFIVCITDNNCGWKSGV